MPSFDNLKDLFKYVEKEVSDSMKKEVSEVVKKVQQKAIEDEVYDKYNIVGGSQQEPYVYERRRDHGGLSDPNNMIEVVQVIGNEIVLQVTNITKGKDDSGLYVAELVEYGDNKGYGEYEYKNNRDGTAYQYRNPRPFTKETINRLKESGQHIDALRRSLKTKGFDIE
jgi:hypothetical protein